MTLRNIGVVLSLTLHLRWFEEQVVELARSVLYSHNKPFNAVDHEPKIGECVGNMLKGCFQTPTDNDGEGPHTPRMFTHGTRH